MILEALGAEVVGDSRKRAAGSVAQDSKTSGQASRGGIGERRSEIWKGIEAGERGLLSCIDK
jgi:hypothetical protein